MSNDKTAAISSDQITRYQTLFNDAKKDAKWWNAQLAIKGILATSADFASDTDMTPVFSIGLDTRESRQSKTKWSLLDVCGIKHHASSIADLFNLSDFELSQNYTNFWDKFEKANYFYQNVLDTADQPLTSRKVAFLSSNPTAGWRPMGHALRYH